MKKIGFLLCLLASFGFYSCTQDEALVEGTSSMSLTAEFPAYQFESETRVSISQNLNAYTWEKGDQIGIYYQDAVSQASAEFTSLNGGSSSSVFTNSAFSLKPNATYYAFYPYNDDATIDAYPVDFTGQVQTENGGTEHIGKQNYMSAAVNTDANGAASIAFQNLAAVIQVVLPVKSAETYTSVTLSTDAADFITQGVLDMRTGAITPTQNSRQVKLSLGKGIALTEGETLTANFLVAPTDLSGKSLTVKLEENGKTVSVTGMGKNIEKGKAYRFGEGDLVEIPYLTFTAEEAQTLKMTKAVETLEYSVNDGDWQELGTSTVTFGGENGDLRLRGKSSMGTAASTADYSRISFGNNSVNVACSGDIRTLVDYANYKTADTSNARFCMLFFNCRPLTSAPELSATDLASRCYQRMFNNCSSLTGAPELPAAILAEYCYTTMFSGCTNLIEAPELPAKTLAEKCYSQMFSGCTNLMEAPELPAKTLANSCYEQMFNGCTSLSSAPELPATTLAESCYSQMFNGCSSLTNAPTLLATDLANRCYQYMFQNCSSLTSAPILPASTLTEACYLQMFYGCSKLNYIKMLATDISEGGCLFLWTEGVAPTGLFVKSKDATWLNGDVVPTGWTVKTDAPLDQNGYGGTADGTSYNNNSISNGNGITW